MSRKLVLMTSEATEETLRKLKKRDEAEHESLAKRIEWMSEEPDEIGGDNLDSVVYYNGSTSSLEMFDRHPGWRIYYARFPTVLAVYRVDPV